MRYVRGGARGRAATGGGVVERQLPARCSRPPGIDDLFEARDRRASSPSSEHLRGQAGAGHVPRRRARRSASSRARRRCSRTRSPGSRPGAPGDFGYVVGVDRVGPGRRAARARRRRRGRGPGGAARRTHDRARRLRGRAVGGARDARSTSTCWPRPSRCSRCPTATSACAATSTRASRTACPAPT